MKERDIRSPEIQNEYLALCEQDADSLWQEEASFVDVNCPACQSEKHTLSFKKQRYPYHVCDNCDTLFMARRPTEKRLGEFYTNSASSRYWADSFYPSCAEKRRLSVYRPRAEFVRDLAVRKQRDFKQLLDIGAGYGIFMEELVRAFPDNQVRGIEPGKELAEVCEKKGLEVFVGLLEEAGHLNDSVDFCASFEVLEHVFSPLEFLRSAQALCRQGGVFFLNTLCCDGLDIQVMWEKHRNVYPVNHINIFSFKGLHLLFEQAGFRNIEVTTPGKLDLDIIRSQMQWEEIPRFLQTIYERENDKLTARFQQFLSENGLSSHTWVVAERI